MAQNDGTLTIDPALRTRLIALASRSGTSFSKLAEAVLRAHADEQERLIDELAEDEERWQRYLAGGETIPFRTVRERLHGLAGEAAKKAESR